jgi:hypothetical protein
MMLQEVQLVGSNLTSKIWAFAHPMHDRYACIKAWLFARLGCLVACTKFDVFGHRDKQCECLDRTLRVILVDILKAGLYNLHNVWTLVLLLW